MAAYVDDLRQLLESAADPVQAPQMSKYMRHRFEYLGLKTPVRRKLASAIIRELASDPDITVAMEVVDDLWAQPEREFQYVGVDLVAKMKDRFTAEHFHWLAGLVVKKSWWDTVDALAVVIGHVALDRPTLWEQIELWSHDTGLIDTDSESAMWLARCSILQQMRYRERTDEDVLFERCTRRSADSDFFIRKAIGWALREYAKTEPNSVWRYVEDHRRQLSNLSVREATKHL